ncbi:hypothetical protein ACJVC5_12965 [Peredibacter sp. HCB2-198]|uniref:hypothetical protein n=1 Tax=Peredibacter sp. HCB2-198 TaxID=3383025 RepID=UPI0038B60629
MKFIVWPLVVVALAISSSCGHNEFPQYKEKEVITLEKEQGNYRAEFKVLNKKWAGKVRGYSILWLRGNQFYTRVSITTRMPYVQHLQYIHMGTKCPDRTSDINQDGIIDFNEVQVSSGRILVPLDGDLATQAGGTDGFPRADEEGAYVYYRAASFRELMMDLRGIPNHQYGKIPEGGEIKLQERVIVIYGTSDSMTVPIACGEIFEDYDAEE